ncbi:unnamed protein product [Adineta steineri]|uniref:Proteasome activator PA28 C-terminal domain-containing protein n=2 Tax=Adineta steineri TaxID=433720 RepID=A0A815GEM0_9BILA|nr:unnamed protein product [Adineta steineri]CAF1475135.1 unnamed protein product [Adineta steineri]CAF3537489.1 unnamed protein product [Adineta steineri]
MSHKRIKIPGAEGYSELLNALEHDGKNIEYITIETIEKINQMLDNDLFNRINLDSIQSIARKSVVNVPTLNDNTDTYDLVIKCNERLEILVKHVKHEEFLFIENAEKICGLIDLNLMYNNGINYETQLLWKNEIIEMQGQISSNHMDILNYYRNRSEIASNILKEPRISDYWEQLIEIDEDFFFKLRTILFNLRLFHLRLFRIVYNWIHPSK